MIKRITAFLAVCLIVCSAEAALAPGGWNPDTKARLDALVERNRGNGDAYAVFDFDYTTAIGDLTYLCMWHVIETMNFRTDDVAALLAEGVPARYRGEVVEQGRDETRGALIPERRCISP